MSSFSDQTITCLDCTESFVFTAAQAKEFDDKGYVNLPARCPECRRKKLSTLRRRREGRAKAYTKPTPAPEIKKADGETKISGGFIAFDGKAKNSKSADKNFGFIEFQGGNIYFALDTFKGPASELTIGTPVIFTCNKDDKGRLQAVTVTVAEGKPRRTPAAAPAADVAPKGEKKERAPRAKKEAAGEKKERAPRAKKEAAERPAKAERPPREMIDIVVSGNGKEAKTVQKPKENGTFGSFRRAIVAAYGKDLALNFALFHNNEALTFEAFNKLSAGAAVEMRPEEKRERKEKA
jgi:cold shock CspA family protein